MSVLLRLRRSLPPCFGYARQVFVESRPGVKGGCSSIALGDILPASTVQPIWKKREPTSWVTRAQL